MNIEIHQPHDSFAKRILSDIAVARELITVHVPADIVKRIDWESLQLTNKSFISKELKQYHSDVVYKCMIDNKQTYIYTLVEHQSTPDELLSFRLLEYNVLLMRQHLDEGNKKLPIIINLCIYAGQESPYPYSVDIFDCFEHIELARGKMFKPAKLLDLTILNQEELLKDGSFGLVEILLKQGIERDHLNWINNNTVLICKITKSPFGSTGVMYILGTDDKNDPEDLLKAIIKASPDQETIIMSAAHKLQEKAKLEGIQTEKMQIAKNMLKEGCEISLIQRITELPKVSIENLKREIEKSSRNK